MNETHWRGEATPQESIPSETSLPDCHRIARLELLDEVEELNLVLAHYAVVWAYGVPLGDNGDGGDVHLEDWMLVRFS